MMFQQRVMELQAQMILEVGAAMVEHENQETGATEEEPEAEAEVVQETFVPEDDEEEQVTQVKEETHRSLQPGRS